ncbi:hypothetical protein [Bacillus sp. EAC]|uniref:hypothetical protein n=1 Tax=Bacillus sp. EAC TaxID=1978338 RepID=UPI000B44D55E|nr:hypothetical protein [Bacillus sp. EAC]
MGIERSIPLANIKHSKKLWRGTRIRLYNIGAYENKEDDFYEYILTEIYDNREYYQFVGYSGHKAGALLCVLKKEIPEHYVLGKTLKEMVGLEDTFILFE